MTEWILIAGCALVLSLPLAWRAAAGRFDPFEPIVLFALAWGTMFVLRPAAVLLRDENTFVGVDISPTLARALALALVGAVGFMAGYELLPGRRIVERLPRPRPVDRSVAAAGALTLCAVAAVALVILLPLSEGLDALRVLLSGRSDEFGALAASTSTYVLNASLLFAPAALVLGALAFSRRSPWLVAAAAGALVLALVRVAPAGGRYVLLPLLGGLFVLAYVTRDKRPRVAVLGAVALVALLASYFTLAFRSPGDDTTVATAVERLADRPHAIFDPLVRGSDAEMVLSLSAALTVVPEELPHRWGGATVGNLVTRPVPREVWPGKPLPPGREVVETIWPELASAIDPAFSPLLVLYWDFGAAGVAVGMAVFGLLFRLLYDWFALHRRALAAQVVFAASLWFVVVGARNDPVDTLVLAAFVIGPVLAVVAVASEGVLPGRVRAAVSAVLARPRPTRARKTA